jgi:hypothetical protein
LVALFGPEDAGKKPRTKSLTDRCREAHFLTQWGKSLDNWG